MKNSDIIAWHCISCGLPLHVDVYDHYLEICKANIIYSSKQRNLLYPSIKKVGLIEGIDKVAGDDDLVFLSLNPYESSLIFPEDSSLLAYQLSQLLKEYPGNHFSSLEGFFGFGFDAIELLDYGAGLRRSDYIDHYKDIARKVAADQDLNYDDEEEYMILGNDLKQALNDFNKRNTLYGEDAIEYLLGAYNRCRDVLMDCYTNEEYIERILKMKELYTIHRSEFWLERCEDFTSIEIVCPKQLSLDLAKYKIVDGVVSYMS